MIRCCKKVLALFTLLLVLGAAAPRALGAEPPDRLRFNRDGTFTVLVLSDLMDTQYTSPYLLRAVKNVLKDVPVDLCVLLGNQVDGGNPLLRLGGGEKNVERTISNLLEPLIDAGVPFAVVPGNSDYAAPADVDAQLAQYRSSALCLTPERSGDSGGAYVLPIYGDGMRVFETGTEVPGAEAPGTEVPGAEAPVMNLYLFDSGPSGAVTERQVDWYIETSGKYRAENGDQPVPAAAFFHAPLPETYELLSPVDKGVSGAVIGSGAGAEHYYRLDSDRIFTGDIRETPAAPADNTGLFDAFVGSDSVFLAVSGHNHTNTFIASYRGVDLASVPGATYTGTGSAAARGVRLFRFNEAAVKDYDTLLIPFSEYDGSPAGLSALHYYLSTTTGIPAYVKAVIAGALLIAAMAVLLVLILKKDARPETNQGEQEEDPPEDPYL